MKTAMKVILRFYIGGITLMKTAVNVILRFYTGEITLMKTAVKVILKFYIGGENSDEDSCESNSKVLYRG
jgi:hypothetical protein